MGIGSYRHLVTLEHPAVVLDPPTWYCALQPAGTQAMEGLAAFFIRGRYHPGIGLETQIVFEGRTFQVQAVNDLDERHTEIQVTAVEVVGRGTTPSGAPVNVPPSIVEGPASTTIDAGDGVTLTVIAAGVGPLSYQWTKDGAMISGETYPFLETGPVAVTTTYTVTVSNAYGSVTSDPAIVTVTPVVPVPPTIVEGPESTTVNEGDVVLLTVVAAGTAPLAYQWTADSADLPGEIYQFLETGPIAVTTAYAVTVSNAHGSVTSDPAIVTVLPVVPVPPSIIEGPASTTIDAGDGVLLTVIAAGGAPLAYQWTANGADLPGEIYQFLETGPITVTTSYAVRVSNGDGAIVSAPAVVTVRPPLTYQQRVIADGASDYWPLDDPSGTVARNMANPYHAAITGGVTLNQPGVTADSKAMTFDGTSGKAVTTAQLSIPLPYTIEIWMKRPTAVAFRAAFSMRSLTGSGTRVAVGQTGGAIVHTSTGSTTGGTVYVGDGLWHHLVWIFSGSAVSLYVNGANDYLDRPLVTTVSLGLAGIGHDVNSGYLDGSVQDVAIYPRALSPAEIAAHYALRVP